MVRKYKKERSKKYAAADDDDDGDDDDNLSFEEGEGGMARGRQQIATTARQRAKLGSASVELLQLEYGSKQKKRKQDIEVKAAEVVKKQRNLRLSKEYNKRKKAEKREAILAKMFTATQKRSDKEEQMIKEQAEQRLMEKRTKRESKFPEAGYVRHVSSKKNGSFLVLPQGSNSKNILASMDG